MGQALIPIEQCTILADHPELHFKEGPYLSSIRREGSHSTLSVTDGNRTFTVPLLWAFGNGKAGQTYVFQYQGALYESRVSFYRELGTLDLTMGAAGRTPATLEQAAGRLMDLIDARECFGCHTTGSVSQGRLHLETMVPGVRCVRCHPAAARHAAAVQSGDVATARTVETGRMSAEDMNELCGGCHRTWTEISLHGPLGVNNVRFQPYRLTNSKCFDPADRRIRCTACHDPHAPVETNLAAYDRACTACHSGARRTRNCRIAKSECVSCHMPKVDLPGAHAAFTDHQIRIVRPGEPYPN